MTNDFKVLDFRVTREDLRVVVRVTVGEVNDGVIREGVNLVSHVMVVFISDCGENDVIVYFIKTSEDDVQETNVVVVVVPSNDQLVAH